MIMNTHINKTNIVREREREKRNSYRIIIEKILYTDERTTMTTTKNKQNYLENRKERRERTTKLIFYC